MACEECIRLEQENSNAHTAFENARQSFNVRITATAPHDFEGLKKSLNEARELVLQTRMELDRHIRRHN